LAAARVAALDSYIIRLTRREQVAGKDWPQETILLKARKNPDSLYLKWVDGDGAGREAVYVRGMYGDKLHILPGSGDGPLFSTQKPLSLAPNSLLPQSRNRHPILDVGFGTLITHFRILAEAAEREDLHVGSVRYLGVLKRPEFDQPVEAVLHAIPAGVEPGLPMGGQRCWYFDLAQHLPVLVVTQDGMGNEVEYYCYDRLLLPATCLSDDEFNPGVIWRK
jgi:hypothetical protein